MDYCLAVCSGKESNLSNPNTLWPVRQSERVGKTRRVIDQRGEKFAVVNRWDAPKKEVRCQLSILKHKVLHLVKKRRANKSNLSWNRSNSLNYQNYHRYQQLEPVGYLIVVLGYCVIEHKNSP